MILMMPYDLYKGLGLGCGIWGLGFGFGSQGLGFRVQGYSMVHGG